MKKLIVLFVLIMPFLLLVVLTRRNAILLLMGIELILNSANINFIAFSRYSTGTFDGQLIAVS